MDFISPTFGEEVPFDTTDSKDDANFGKIKNLKISINKYFCFNLFLIIFI